MTLPMQCAWQLSQFPPAGDGHYGGHFAGF